MGQGLLQLSSRCRQGWARQRGGEEETHTHTPPLQIPNFLGCPGALQVLLGPRSTRQPRDSGWTLLMALKSHPGGDGSEDGSGAVPLHISPPHPGLLN